MKPQDSQEDRDPFWIDTLQIREVGSEVTLSKPGITQGSQEIVVSSQANGRVSSLVVRPGARVQGGQPIVMLADSLANYWSVLQRAQNSLQRVLAQRDDTILSLNNSVDNTYASLVQAQDSLRLAEQTAEQTLKSQQLAVLQSSNTSSGSLNTTFNSYTLQRSTLLSQLNSILNISDILLGVTDIYELENDAFETQISAKNTELKKEAEVLLRELYDLRNLIVAVSWSIIDGQMIFDSLPVMEDAYVTAQELLQQMQLVLINSVSGPVLSQAQIDGYYNSVTNQLSSLLTAKNAFVSFQQNAETQLVVLTDGVQGIDYNPVSAEIALEQARLNVENTISNAQIAVDNAQRAYNQALSVRDTQLALLETNIADAQLVYQDALRQYNKLTVSSPIRGTIGDILVDVGQELSVGTPVFTVVSVDDQLVNIYVTANEYMLIQANQSVNVSVNGKSYMGFVQSLIPVAGTAWQYQVIIALNESMSLLGDVVMVDIPVRVWAQLLPLSLVTTTEQNKWFIWILDDGELEKKKVELGQIWWDKVEILSDVDASWQIVVSDVSQYNDIDFYLAVQTGDFLTGMILEN